MRTLGLIEVLFAMMLSPRFSTHRMSAHEAWGIAIIVIGTAIVMTVAQSTSA